MQAVAAFEYGCSLDAVPLLIRLITSEQRERCVLKGARKGKSINRTILEGGKSP
jgi:hypothetical protein